jgi:hypothetical protein
MKHLKGFGLAGFAAAVLIMSAGAPSASATEFCSTETSPCTGTMYGSGTKFAGKSTNPILTSSITNVTCELAQMGGELTSTGGTGSTPISGTVTSATWTNNCKTASGTACTITVLNLPWSMTGEEAAGENEFTVTVAGKPGVTVKCGFLINCTFTQTSLVLSGENGNPAYVTATAEALNTEGGFCPATASYDAKYEITTPKPLFAV